LSVRDVGTDALPIHEGCAGSLVTRLSARRFTIENGREIAGQDLLVAWRVLTKLSQRVSLNASRCSPKTSKVHGLSNIKCLALNAVCYCPLMPVLRTKHELNPAWRGLDRHGNKQQKQRHERHRHPLNAQITNSLRMRAPVHRLRSINALQITLLTSACNEFSTLKP
jgi:hypothetical protein